MNELISKYLESHILRGSYATTTINTYQPKSIDLAISNYAFSELPRNLQEAYIQKVLLKSTKGYLTMNEQAHIATTKKSSWTPYHLEDLRSKLPTFEIIDETPSTGSGNYIIIWGHR